MDEYEEVFISDDEGDLASQLDDSKQTQLDSEFSFSQEEIALIFDDLPALPLSTTPSQSPSPSLSLDVPEKKVAKKRKSPAKLCPAYKKIEGTNFIVDGFKYKSDEYNTYFLTYFVSFSLFPFRVRFLTSLSSLQTLAL
jgi:hypothetical protein